MNNLCNVIKTGTATFEDKKKLKLLSKEIKDLANEKALSSKKAKEKIKLLSIEKNELMESKTKESELKSKIIESKKLEILKIKKATEMMKIVQNSEKVDLVFMVDSTGSMNP